MLFLLTIAPVALSAAAFPNLPFDIAKLIIHDAQSLISVLDEEGNQLREYKTPITTQVLIEKLKEDFKEDYACVKLDDFEAFTFRDDSEFTTNHKVVVRPLTDREKRERDAEKRGERYVRQIDDLEDFEARRHGRFRFARLRRDRFEDLEEVEGREDNEAIREARLRLQRLL